MPASTRAVTSRRHKMLSKRPIQSLPGKRPRRASRGGRSRADLLHFFSASITSLNMKIATFNINNVNRRLPNLLRWLRAAKPDVVCLQELKAADDAFPRTAIEQAGYGAVWRGQQTWNGVAILARKAEPILTRTALPGDRADQEARYIE